MSELLKSLKAKIDALKLERDALDAQIAAAEVAKRRRLQIIQPSWRTPNGVGELPAAIEAHNEEFRRIKTEAMPVYEPHDRPEYVRRITGVTDKWIFVRTGTRDDEQYKRATGLQKGARKQYEWNTIDPLKALAIWAEHRAKQVPSPEPPK